MAPLRLASALALPWITGLIACCSSAGVAEQRVAPFQLDAATSADWSAYLRHSPEETAWLEIPWQVSFADGLRAAALERKPLLLWGMNGHPLGAT